MKQKLFNKARQLALKGSWRVRASWKRLRQPIGSMKQDIGGEFEVFGQLELALLKFYGLHPDHYVIDVGCGAGRLTEKLARFLTGPYLGTDVHSARLDYARRIARRPDWKFKRIRSYEIPESDDLADYVCFYSVLTHVSPEIAYLYLEEAKRVLKPGGVIIFSFLEFAVRSHWRIFASMVEQERCKKRKSPDFLISRDAIQAWADRLSLNLEDMRSGTEAFIPLDKPVRLSSGVEMHGLGYLGQSTCVLRKPGRTDEMT